MPESTHEPTPGYRPPELTVLGSVQQLTNGCDKTLGSSDGFTFQGTTIVCSSSA